MRAKLLMVFGAVDFTGESLPLSGP